MFYFLSKTAGYLAQPLVIVCLLFISGLLVRTPRRKKMLLISAFSLLIVFSNHYLANTAMRAWEVQPIPFKDLTGVYDYGILLTGITKGQPGPDDRVYFNAGVDRATHTLQLYKMGLIRKVLISGGSGYLTSVEVREGQDIAAFMTMAGVAQDDILIENKSVNTHESALMVDSLLQTIDGGKRLLLITSGYHIPRAHACFAKVGLSVDPFPTNPLTRPELSVAAWFIPSTEAFGMWQALFRELAGMAAYKVAGYI